MHRLLTNGSISISTVSRLIQVIEEVKDGRPQVAVTKVNKAQERVEEIRRNVIIN